MIIKEFQGFDLTIYHEFIQQCFKKDYTNQYTQKHHILPKCMNGKNNNSNIIHLNLQDHFDAHLILAGCFPEGNEFRWKNICSANYIIHNLKRSCNQQIFIDNVDFWTTCSKIMKDIISKNQSGANNHFYGRRHSDESIQKMKESHTGRVISEEERTRRKISARRGSDNHNFGKTWKASEETKRKISEASKRNNAVRFPMPEGIYQNETFDENNLKKYFRICPECNCRVYHTDRRYAKKMYLGKQPCQKCVNSRNFSNRIFLIDIETNKIFLSKKEACKYYNLSHETLGKRILENKLCRVIDINNNTFSVTEQGANKQIVLFQEGGRTNVEIQ